MLAQITANWIFISAKKIYSFTAALKRARHGLRNLVSLLNQCYSKIFRNHNNVIIYFLLYNTLPQLATTSAKRILQSQTKYFKWLYTHLAKVRLTRLCRWLTDTALDKPQ